MFARFGEATFPGQSGKPLQVDTLSCRISMNGLGYQVDHWLPVRRDAFRSRRFCRAQSDRTL